MDINNDYGSLVNNKYIDDAKDYALPDENLVEEEQKEKQSISTIYSANPSVNIDIMIKETEKNIEALKNRDNSYKDRVSDKWIYFSSKLETLNLIKLMIEHYLDVCDFWTMFVTEKDEERDMIDSDDFKEHILGVNDEQKKI